MSRKKKVFCEDCKHIRTNFLRMPKCAVQYRNYGYVARGFDSLQFCEIKNRLGDCEDFQQREKPLKWWEALGLWSEEVE